MKYRTLILLAATIVSAGVIAISAPAVANAAASPNNGQVKLAYQICYDDGVCCEAVDDDGYYDDKEETCNYPASYKTTDPTFNSLHPFTPTLQLSIPRPNQPTGKI